jgi:ABC-type uncharacterized transport system substrate-binding protein
MRDVPGDSPYHLAMDRRRFLLTSLGALFGTSLVAEAQPAGKVYRIGFLALIPGENTTLMKALQERLHELGYVEGKNLIFEYRSAEGRQERLAELASELVLARPDVLVAGAGTLAPLALKAATTTIPIVFTSVGDPIGAGVVASIARPGGNLTGLTGQSADVAAKRFQLLREIVPDSRLIAMLMNPATPFAMLALKETRTAADAAHVRLEVLELKARDQLADRFESATRARASGMIVSSDPLTYELRHEISHLAAKFRLPTMYGHRDHPEAGGLISYGANRRQMYRRAAEYADKILKGAKAANLPVEQPTTFELVINLQTAKALGLTIPPSLLARADQVIE